MDVLMNYPVANYYNVIILVLPNFGKTQQKH